MMTEVEQLQRIKDRDPNAFAEWLAGAEHRLRASLSRFARTVDTEAVMQECLLTVWQVAPRVEPDGKPDSLLRYAIRIAHNLALREIRRTRPDVVDPEVIAESISDILVPEVSQYDELRSTIDRCQEQLPIKPREAISARLAGAGIPDKHLARTVGMTLNTFLQNIRRARLALAKCLRKHGYILGIPS
jgi:RNA polymerase sigma factor (sigma-70 family)